MPYICRSVLQCVAVCCSVLQCVAVCCSALQCVAVIIKKPLTQNGIIGSSFASGGVSACRSELQYIAVIVLQSVAISKFDHTFAHFKNFRNKSIISKPSTFIECP